MKVNYHNLVLHFHQKLLKPLFRSWLLISLITVFWVNTLTPVNAQVPRQEIRGVWVTNNDLNILKDRTKVQEAVTQLRELNFNTVYPVIWNAGYVMYPSQVAKDLEIQPFVFKGLDGHDILADLIDKSHRQKLLVIPWFEFGFMTPDSSELALNKPGWLTQKQDGGTTSVSAAGEVSWLNPFHPEVQQFIIDLLVELTNKYDIDGIQFDDHTSLPHEFGYDKYTVALYTKETQKTPPKDYKDPEWVNWRANKITEFMVRLNNTVKQIKPKMIFSISPNYYDYAYKFQLQDWLNWARLNIVDELVMQVYRENLDSFTSKLSRPEIEEVKQIIPTGIGIMAGLRTKPVSIQQIQSQVRAVQQRDLGVAFFYYESLWNIAPESLGERLAGFKNLFPYPALRTATPDQLSELE
ncbi:glycoside hydrolase family 10 protein [Dolichospermum circinale CS-534/05]|uniref:glycoside hydrolase family 10 protein n=1 Tax=Dolichospermum circinale TaxID=109265 RepID=UPI00232B2770|nr:glycoside hydrolase family 10 protein [Dolichospermum circinale]MDB9455204.1 glycoside hydrolase family 10 protein [Dolichospermum circinale CS-541/06]MDB9462019.1 glycoside hydrolase family 10 protein [Dolichospermum circinale CS-541/04]MDB9491884.1 glycoside hydrolase family 10 protein [Dolichospermum circinale CS-534/05]MDB9549480.1 glycoside hydrolase family 10 protein [Dolichospermum circinale CS-1031]